MRVMRFGQMDAPISPPSSPPRSDAPISHQPSERSVQSWQSWRSWWLCSGLWWRGGGGGGAQRTTSCLGVWRIGAACAFAGLLAGAFSMCLAGAGALATRAFCTGAFIAAGAPPFGGGLPFGAANAVPQSVPHMARANIIFCIALFIVVFLSLFSASQFSRLHVVRISQRRFLTVFFDATRAWKRSSRRQAPICLRKPAFSFADDSEKRG